MSLNNKKHAIIGLTTVFSLISSIALTPVTLAQTVVDVPLKKNDRGVVAPPNCDFPCPDLDLPPFARQLALAGPSGSFKTDLTRRAFLDRLEDWRLFIEVYRKSIEKKQLDAPDWNEANVVYKVDLGLYDQFLESYRNAFKMDKAGNIQYGSIIPTPKPDPQS